MIGLLRKDRAEHAVLGASLSTNIILLVTVTPSLFHGAMVVTLVSAIAIAKEYFWDGELFHGRPDWVDVLATSIGAVVAVVLVLLLGWGH